MCCKFAPSVFRYGIRLFGICPRVFVRSESSTGTAVVEAGSTRSRCVARCRPLRLYLVTERNDPVCCVSTISPFLSQSGSPLPSTKQGIVYVIPEVNPYRPQHFTLKSLETQNPTVPSSLVYTFPSHLHSPPHPPADQDTHQNCLHHLPIPPSV